MASTARIFMGIGACALLIMVFVGGTMAQNGPSKKLVKCELKEYTKCYDIEYPCPDDCKDSCVVDCVTCKPVCECDQPGAVCRDPRFIGGDGIMFYFHGQKDKDFCLLSDSNLHINGHFIGKRNPAMKRDFTWVQSIGILFNNHRIFVGAQKTDAWDDSVDRLALAFDGEPIFLPLGKGAQWRSAVLPSVSIMRSHVTNGVIVEVDGNFRITATVVPITKQESRVHGYDVTEEDCMAHLNLGFKFYSLTGDVTGVLGQTYGNNYISRVNMGVAMPVMGGDREFASTSLFATDCAVARFNGIGASSGNVDFASLSCGSGIDGRGVVCKR